jgi:ribosome biogenesis GTPase A
MNHFNTDFNQIPKTEEERALMAVQAFKPMQHPKQLDADDSSIVSYKVPPKNLTPYYSVPDQARVDLDLVYKDSPMGARTLEAAIIGAPNSGKSSLMNYMVNKNVSAVSDKYNTTDEPVTGIHTDYDERT